MTLLNWKVIALGLFLALLIWVNNPRPLALEDAVGDWVPVGKTHKDTGVMRIRIQADGSYEFSKVPCYFVRFPIHPGSVELCDGKGEWKLPQDRANLISLSGRNSSFSLSASGNRLRLDHRNVDLPVFIELERDQR